MVCVCQSVFHSCLVTMMVNTACNCLTNKNKKCNFIYIYIYTQKVVKKYLTVKLTHFQTQCQVERITTQAQLSEG